MEPKLNKLQKTIKIRKKASKKNMFSYGFFPNFMQFKLHISSKFEYGASFDIPGVPGGVSIVKVQEFRDLF